MNEILKKSWLLRWGIMFFLLGVLSLFLEAYHYDLVTQYGEFERSFFLYVGFLSIAISLVLEIVLFIKIALFYAKNNKLKNENSIQAK